MVREQVWTTLVGILVLLLTWAALTLTGLVGMTAHLILLVVLLLVGVELSERWWGGGGRR